jgi:predicted aminopeptidase
MDTRAQLATLYGDKKNPAGKFKATKARRQVSRPTLRRQKEAIFDHLRQAYAALKVQWGGNSEYDAWFSRQLNNAKLNSVAAYYDLVPSFRRLLADNGGDLEKFYQAVERLARMPKPQRHQALRSPVPGPPGAGSRPGREVPAE